jgi:hypothetical protein
MFQRYVDDRGREWMVGAEGASHILRAYAHATAVLKRSKLQRETHFFECSVCETDFKGLSDRVNREAGALAGDLVHQVRLDGAAMRETLVGFRKKTITAHA